jgi:hypothetical protein
VKNKPMRLPSLTLVGEEYVPVRGANFPTLVYFRAGEHGLSEAGAFHFWTAVLSEPRRFKGKLRKVSIGRAFAVQPPGERFHRFMRDAVISVDPEEREHNVGLWNFVIEAGRNISFIRPSTVTEVRRWMSAHDTDTQYAKSIFYRGQERPITP